MEGKAWRQGEQRGYANGCPRGSRKEVREGGEGTATHRFSLPFTLSHTRGEGSVLPWNGAKQHRSRQDQRYHLSVSLLSLSLSLPFSPPSLPLTSLSLVYLLTLLAINSLACSFLLSLPKVYVDKINRTEGRLWAVDNGPWGGKGGVKG